MPNVKNQPDQKAQGRRQNRRVSGPFDGRWRAALPVPLKIHDLSLGGCLIHAMHDVRPGRQITIDVHLPYEGWLTLDAETVYSRPDYGFAVKFVNVPELVRAKLERVIDRLLSKLPHEE